MNTPKEQQAANSSLTTCPLSLEDRAAEYAEALNDIADMLRLPTGATSADIVAACYRELNMETEQNQVATSTQPMNTPKTDQLWSELEQLGWKRDRLPVSKIMASHEALELESALRGTTCSTCGERQRKKADYGDFSEYEVRCLVAEYCMSVTLGCTGWGVDFKTWVELQGIAKHDGMFRLIRLPNSQAHPPQVE